MFSTLKNVLYDILKVLRNSVKGKAYIEMSHFTLINVVNSINM